jgi:hypothetical protein
MMYYYSNLVFSLEVKQAGLVARVAICHGPFRLVAENVLRGTIFCGPVDKCMTVEGLNIRQQPCRKRFDVVLIVKAHGYKYGWNEVWVLMRRAAQRDELRTQVLGLRPPTSAAPSTCIKTHYQSRRGMPM